MAETKEVPDRSWTRRSGGRVRTGRFRLVSLIAAVLAMATLVGLSTAAVGQEGSTGSVGAVVMDTDGRLVAGMTVDLFSATADGGRGQWVRYGDTDAEGAVVFDGLDLADGQSCFVMTFIAGEGRVFAGGGGYLNHNACLTGDEPEQRVSVSVLDSGSSESIEIATVDADGGPLAGVVVDLYTLNADGSRSRWLGDRTTADDGTVSVPVQAACYALVLIAPAGREWVDGQAGTPWRQVGLCVDAGGVGSVRGALAADTTPPPGPPTTTTTTAPPTTTTTAAPTTTTTAPPPPTTAPLPPGGSAKVPGYQEEACLGRSDGGSQLVLQPCDSDLALDVGFVPVGSTGYGELRVGTSCITVENASREPGVVGVIGNCGTGDQSLWVAADWEWGDNYAYLRNKLSGLCLRATEWARIGEPVFSAKCDAHSWENRGLLWESSFVDGLMARDLNNVPPVQATYHGVLPFASFHEGTYPMDSWTYGDIAFYAPPGKVTNEMANRYIAWYSHMDALHRRVWNQDNFDSVYRRDDANHGRKKIVAIIEEGLCSCGSKQQAEILGFMPRIGEQPENWLHHWVMFYEMNRGGPTPNFYARATWPNTHQGGLILPHMMAGLAFYELGGPAGLERGVLGHFLSGLTTWRVEETMPLDELEIPADIQMGILLTILQEEGTDTFIDTLHNMAEKPPATGPTQALCDFRAAVNESTGGRFEQRMTNDWRLPTSC